MGWQLGGTPANEVVRPVAVSEGHKKTFRYDPRTWESMWDEVGEKTGTKWKVAVVNDVPEWLTRQNETRRQWSTRLERTFSVMML
jgi:hypothetical protein